MEEQEELQKKIRDLEAKIEVVSAQAESAEDIEDKKFFRQLLLKKEDLLLKLQEKEVLLIEKEKLMQLERLETRGSAAGLGLETTTGSGSAAGLGLESTTGSGLPSCKLRLQQDLENQDLYFLEPTDSISAAAPASPGVRSLFFLDPKGQQISELQDWLRLAKELHHKRKPICPLFINGLVKTGKSYMLNEVLPAVVNTYYCSGGSGQQHANVVRSEPNFLRVDCSSCNRSNGVGGFLMTFLFKLKRSAADQQLSAAASTPVPSNCSPGSMSDAIQDFMRRLPRDHLNFLLVDEAQSFYLLRRLVSDDRQPSALTLDVDAVLYMRSILKELLLDSPHWVAWAITGSSMATLWANVAVTPPNGFTLIMHHRRLNLSPMVSEEVLEVAWEQLKAEAATWNPALPNDLLWQSPRQIAMLAYLCQEWRLDHSASTAVELINQTMIRKIIPEVLEDLRMVLQVLGERPGQLLFLLELVDPYSGVEPAKLPEAFKVLLGSFANEREGRLHLDCPLLARVFKAVITDSGELVDSITAVKWISSPMYRELIALGERCKNSKHCNCDKDLHSLLEDMAIALALVPDELLKEDWFVQVLEHRCNSHGSKDSFDKEYRAKVQNDVKVGLSCFYWLLRNILCHGRISEHQWALEVYPSTLANFHNSRRVSEVLTKPQGIPTPKRSKTPGASALAPAPNVPGAGYGAGRRHSRHEPVAPPAPAPAPVLLGDGPAEPSVAAAAAGERLPRSGGRGVGGRGAGRGGRSEGGRVGGGGGWGEGGGGRHGGRHAYEQQQQHPHPHHGPEHGPAHVHAHGRGRGASSGGAATETAGVGSDGRSHPGRSSGGGAPVPAAAAVVASGPPTTVAPAAPSGGGGRKGRTDSAHGPHGTHGGKKDAPEPPP